MPKNTTLPVFVRPAVRGRAVGAAVRRRVRLGQHPPPPRQATKPEKRFLTPFSATVKGRVTRLPDGRCICDPGETKLAWRSWHARWIVDIQQDHKLYLGDPRNTTLYYTIKSIEEHESWHATGVDPKFYQFATQNNYVIEKRYHGFVTEARDRGVKAMRDFSKMIEGQGKYARRDELSVALCEAWIQEILDKYLVGVEATGAIGEAGHFHLPVIRPLRHNVYDGVRRRRPGEVNVLPPRQKRLVRPLERR